ncbi:MAG: PDC sensor domain-containing protein [Defluviitaleaceae bacterium]|nr:PDC sensor domain-containing protein [Defluviitaleaceae bacterium]
MKKKLIRLYIVLLGILLLTACDSYDLLYFGIEAGGNPAVKTEGYDDEPREVFLMTAYQINQQLDDIVHIIETLSSRLLDTPSEHIASVLIETRDEHHFIEMAHISFTDGRSYDSAIIQWPRPDFWVAYERPWWIAAEESGGNAVFSAPYVNIVADVSVTVSKHILDFNGYSAVVLLDIDLGRLISVADGLMLIDAENRIIAHYNPLYLPIYRTGIFDYEMHILPENTQYIYKITLDLTGWILIDLGEPESPPANHYDNEDFTYALHEYIQTMDSLLREVTIYVAESSELVAIVNGRNAGHRDREPLIDYLADYATLASTITIVDQDGRVILRTHTPYYYGDWLILPSITRALHYGDTMSALTPAPAIPLAFAVITPIWDGESIIGAVMVHLESDMEQEFVNDLIGVWRK